MTLEKRRKNLNTYLRMLELLAVNPDVPGITLVVRS